jgi:outer membrane receptor protein involved in Fe transport
MKKCWIIILLVFIVAVFHGFSQTGQTGSIKGTVTDPDNLPLPGVIVTLESSALIVNRTTITNNSGNYRFPGLPPGIFRLTFQMDGMKTVVRSPITVNIGKTAVVNVTLELSPIEERVEVPGRAPAIDRQSTGGVTNLEAQQLGMVPTPGRTVMDYFNMTAGINNNSAHGSGEMENAYNLEGVNMGDPVTSTEYVTFGMDVMEEVAVLSGGLSAEYGSVKGAVLNVVTKSGGNTLHGSAYFYYQQEKLQANNTRGTDLYDRDNPELTGRKFQMEPGFTLGGPVVKNKLWFFGNLSMISREDYAPGYPHDATPGNTTGVDQKEYFPYLKLTYQASRSDTFVLSYNYSDLTSQHRGASRYYTESTTQVQESPTHVINAHWSKTFGSTIYANLKMALIKSDINFHAKSPGPQYTDWLSGLQTGSYWRNQDDSQRDRYQVNLDVTTYIDNVVGTHELKVGSELQMAKSRWIMDVTPDRDTKVAWQFNWPEYVGGTGIYYGFHIKPFDRKEEMLNYSFFLNDTWSINRHLTLNLGVRYDYNSIIIPAQNQEEEPIFNPFGLWVDRRIYETFTPIQWRNLSPRLGLIYDIFADGSTLFKASWSTYIQPNTTQWVNTVHPNGWYYWIDIYHGYTFVQSSQSLVKPGNTQVGYGDYDLKASKAEELTIGLQREMGNDWSIGIRYIKKWDKNLVHIVDASALDIDALMDGGELLWLNWEPVQATDPYDGETVTFYNNLDASRIPQQYLVNPPGAKRDYDSLELTVQKRFSRGWWLNMSYVYANARGLIAMNRDATDGAQSLGTSYLWKNPNAHINATGRFPFERRHQLKVTGLLRGPWGIDMGGYFRYLSGQRWTRAITSTYLGLELYQLPETIKAEERGSEGYPAIVLLDLKVEKTFKLGTIYLKLFADVFNLLNANTVTEEYLDSSNPVMTYGEDLNILSPRVVRLGARLEF